MSVHKELVERNLAEILMQKVKILRKVNNWLNMLRKGENI